MKMKMDMWKTCEGKLSVNILHKANIYVLKIKIKNAKKNNFQSSKFDWFSPND